MRPRRIWRGNLPKNQKIFRVSFLTFSFASSARRSRHVSLASLAPRRPSRFRSRPRALTSRGSRRRRYRARSSNIQFIWLLNRIATKRNHRQRNWRSFGFTAGQTISAPFQTHRSQRRTWTTPRSRQSSSASRLGTTKDTGLPLKSGGCKVRTRSRRRANPL